MLTLEQMKSLYETLYNRTHVPCCVLDGASRAILYPKNSPLVPYLDMIGGIFEQDESPVHALSIYRYLVASFWVGEHIVLVGPCRQLEFGGDDEGAGLAVIRQYTSTETAESFREIVRFIYQLTTHRTVDVDAIPLRRIDEAEMLHEVAASLEQNMESRRAEEATRDSYQFELKYLDYVRRGRKDKIGWIIGQIDKTYRPKLGTTEFETMRYKFIALDTLLTRLAIREGVPLDVAFSLSDALLGRLHAVRSAKAMIDYFQYMSFSFADLIARSDADGSPLVHQVTEYVSEHLGEKVTLDDLAAATGHAGSYVSAAFKRETGKTVSRYILERKVEEAEHLLLFTDTPAQGIAAKLGFSSQSHFIAQFKKVTGQTPREYRTRNFYYL